MKCSKGQHGVSDFVATRKRFLNLASAKQNGSGDNVTSYGDFCNCCGKNS